jgi:ABC-type multidrug transport system permease subunit
VWLRVLIVIALVNFTTCWIIAYISGGFALGGKVEGLRYFLINHGRYTEVSHAFFVYSYVHSIAVFITHPAAVLCLIYYYLRTFIRRMSSDLGV